MLYLKVFAVFFISVLTIISSTIIYSPANASGKGAHWGYHGGEGPSHWGDLSHDYELCKTGVKQTPINIDMTKGATLNPIEFYYKPSVLTVYNNGHTIQVNYDKGSFIKIGSRRFDLLQFHFHSPSENQVKGVNYAMEMHLVHKAADGQLAVVGVMFSRGGENKIIRNVWHNMPKAGGETIRTNQQVNAMDLLPTSQKYFHFTGSLTTPPCSEGVVWNVMQAPLEVSSSQVSEFLRVIGENNRPIQPEGTRAVYSN